MARVVKILVLLMITVSSCNSAYMLDDIDIAPPEYENRLGYIRVYNNSLDEDNPHWKQDWSRINIDVFRLDYPSGSTNVLSYYVQGMWVNTSGVRLLEVRDSYMYNIALEYIGYGGDTYKAIIHEVSGYQLMDTYRIYLNSYY